MGVLTKRVLVFEADIFHVDALSLHQGRIMVHRLAQFTRLGIDGLVRLVEVDFVSI
jgi:hypothetical protein